jgi:cytochrome c peroxidase
MAAGRAAPLIAVLAAALVATGCSFGDDPQAGEAARAQAAAQAFAEQAAVQVGQRRALSAVAAGDTGPGGVLTATPVTPGTPGSPVGAEELMDWAQFRFPAFFPPGPVSFPVPAGAVTFTVRAYPTGNFLGVTQDGEVYGLGPFTGGQLLSLGFLSRWTAAVLADRCSVYPGRCPAPSGLDEQLRPLLAANGLSGDPALGRRIPSIDDPLPQLGRLLFFSKALSANRDTACASCHHPALGGADGLSVSVGTGAALPDVLGPGRRHASGQLTGTRNANTFFNTALLDINLFWDGRVERLPDGGIRTPATAFGVADPRAGATLLAAQARSPIVTAAEMRGDALPGLSPEQYRAHIAARLGDYGSGLGGLPPAQWLPRFRAAFGQPQGTAEQLITFDHIVRAIAEYQASATFTDTPWRRYVRGELTALDDDAKRGALLFYRDVRSGGAQCVQCHKGDNFSDERFHAIGFPQIGPGMGDPGRDDLGRQRASGNPADARAFRTTPLLNVELSAPYGHSGAYASLFTVMDHYVFPRETVVDFLAGRQWCFLPQFQDIAGCTQDVADVDRNTRAALARMEQLRVLDPANAMPVIDPRLGSPQDTPRLVAFMRALTDPCLKDRACFGRWIPRPEEAPDGFQLNATDAGGRPL